MVAKKKKNLKICLIGNSHSGSFKSGWEAISAYYPKVGITFFPHTSHYYHKFGVDTASKLLTMDDPVIRERFYISSGGMSDIDFGVFDMCMIVGGMFHWRLHNRPRFSARVAAATARDSFIGQHTSILVEKIRMISDVPIIIVPNPYGARNGVAAASKIESIAFENELINRFLSTEHNARIVPQPEETMLTEYVSRLEYAVGERKREATPGADGQPEVLNDLAHMNAAYGALFLSQILAEQGFRPKDLQLPEPDGRLSISKPQKGTATGG